MLMVILVCYAYNCFFSAMVVQNNYSPRLFWIVIVISFDEDIQDMTQANINMDYGMSENS